MSTDPLIDQLVNSVSTMTLATTDPEGHPHAAPVYFVAVDKDQGLRLYFFSESESVHSQHIAQNPKVAAALYPECQGWRDIRGLQLHGEVHLVGSERERDSAWQQYLLKFPFVRALKAVVAQNHFYVFVPCWIRLVDNAQGFGFKKEWNLT